MTQNLSLRVIRGLHTESFAVTGLAKWALDGKYRAAKSGIRLTIARIAIGIEMAAPNAKNTIATCHTEERKTVSGTKKSGKVVWNRTRKIAANRSTVL